MWQDQKIEEKASAVLSEITKKANFKTIGVD